MGAKTSLTSSNVSRAHDGTVYRETVGLVDSGGADYNSAIHVSVPGCVCPPLERLKPFGGAFCAEQVTWKTN